MTFHIITIFPAMFDSYMGESILKRAQRKKLLEIKIHDLRDFARSKHKQVDDRPYGGGAGMVLKIEPIAQALESILRSTKHETRNAKQSSRHKFSTSKTKIILLSAHGMQFDAVAARRFAKKYDRIIMIAGHYEGVDERVRKIVSDFGFRISDLSIGPYILTGGELAAMVVVDAVSRHLPGVLGKQESLEEIKGSYPVYTRPEVFRYKGRSYRAPAVLLSGDHKKISAWRTRRAPKGMHHKKMI